MRNELDVVLVAFRACKRPRNENWLKPRYSCEKHTAFTRTQAWSKAAILGWRGLGTTRVWRTWKRADIFFLGIGENRGVAAMPRQISNMYRKTWEIETFNTGEIHLKRSSTVVPNFRSRSKRVGVGITFRIRPQHILNCLPYLFAEKWNPSSEYDDTWSPPTNECGWEPMTLF